MVYFPWLFSVSKIQLQDKYLLSYYTTKVAHSLTMKNDDSTLVIWNPLTEHSPESVSFACFSHYLFPWDQCFSVPSDYFPWCFCIYIFLCFLHPSYTKSPTYFCLPLLGNVTSHNPSVTSCTVFTSITIVPQITILNGLLIFHVPILVSSNVTKSLIPPLWIMICHLGLCPVKI
jgi:hypothetical protein